MNRIGGDRGWPPYQRTQYDFGRSSHGHLIIGDADYAVDKILKIQESLGLTRFSAHMDVGAPNHIDMMKAIEVLEQRSLLRLELPLIRDNKTLVKVVFNIFISERYA